MKKASKSLIDKITWALSIILGIILFFGTIWYAKNAFRVGGTSETIKGIFIIVVFVSSVWLFVKKYGSKKISDEKKYVCLSSYIKDSFGHLFLFIYGLAIFILGVWSIDSINNLLVGAILIIIGLMLISGGIFILKQKKEKKSKEK